MGGRGTYASGKSVSHVYKTVNKIEGIKVLEPLDSKKSFSMPAEAHSSLGYITLDKTGTFRQYREYNTQHLPTFEIGYHFEKVYQRTESPSCIITNTQLQELNTAEKLNHLHQHLLKNTRNISKEFLYEWKNFIRIH